MSSLAIKISSDLATAARQAAAHADRSLTAQVEHWARLGQVADQQLTGSAMLALKHPDHAVSKPEDQAEILALLENLRQPGWATKKALESGFLDGRTVTGSDPRDPSILVRRDAKGVETRGTLIDGEFVPLGR